MISSIGIPTSVSIGKRSWCPCRIYCSIRETTLVAPSLLLERGRMYSNAETSSYVGAQATCPARARQPTPLVA